MREELIIAGSQKCGLRLVTPFADIQTDSYMCFLKTGRNGRRIEVNNLSLDDIIEFKEELNKIIIENRKQL